MIAVRLYAVSLLFLLHFIAISYAYSFGRNLTSTATPQKLSTDDTAGGGHGIYRTVDLQWWDPKVEEWKAFRCDSGVGPCISFDALPGSYRILSAYIKKGTKLTVHLNNIGYDHDFQVLIKSAEPPTETDYDYQMTRKEPGFTQWSCRGVSMFFRVQLPNNVHKKAKFGVTLTEDNCIEKDYSVRCPGGWKDQGSGWCQPPKFYTGPCRKQNYFGEYNMGRDYSNPASKVYKILWAERCGADWPCKEVIGRQCMPDLQYVHKGQWHLTACKNAEVCQMFTLAEEHKKDDWRMLLVEVPPTSSVAVEVGSVITLKAVNRFREQVGHGSGADDALGKDEFTLAVRKGDTEEGEEWQWTDSFRGAAPYVELHNPLCDRFQKFFLGLYNNNRKSGAAKVGVTLNRLDTKQTKTADHRCRLSHIRGAADYARAALVDAA
uniref:CPW-WPC domain-containing protein n=1 Tax=Pyramimonas obovata TaxID=1411642 RepID=A0A7S0R261_9CHLO|mmetsp:Transcript_23895/g.52192  ORF Transcript_23895/g.52192 Transcript_23895/m.52192 type:complete len:434 (+) Transcript_23895:186-1487(+)|eukprot:CAMPEP_0118937062 /NCGR_PEP_ID=MMETSP1169-20130426/21494_1 /TAXON_ID=36882 /ORGANISM="Pyramimonas obovata, Strain CCMP722" /LENGTH=433 /DNA_ID=CAMNT_0006880581 /DNA_START=109 /DNA_END=1410 /DNA_ORIENTATION=-